MIHDLLSRPTNRRFFSLFRHPAFSEVHKLQDTNIVLEDKKPWRLMTSAATAREVSNDVTSKRKVISRKERKALVETYVDQYRLMNDGKFPSAANVIKHVGGGYYNVKAILQEYEHSSKVAVGATAAISSTTNQIARVNEIFDGEAAPNFQLSDDRITVEEDCGILPEVDSSCEVVVDKISHENMVYASTLSKYHERTTECVSGLERNADLELEGENEKTSDDNDVSNETSILEIQEVPLTSSLANTLENTFTMENCVASSKPSLPSEVSSTSKNSDIDESVASAQALKSGEVLRGTKIQQTRDEQVQESSLWGNMKLFASNIISFWR